MTNNNPIADTRLIALEFPQVVIILTDPWGEFEEGEEHARIIAPLPSMN